ncbi:hypothetical protein C2E23DRAFT_859477, partial [Lenzites betulinus]
ISVMPDGSHRDDAIGDNIKTYARVVGVANHKHWGPLVKVHWFFNYNELDPDFIRNEAGKDFLETVGRKELISLSHDTYMFADCIWAIETVVGFDETTISLPVTDGSEHVYRENKSLVRSFNLSHDRHERYLLPLSCITYICWPQCDGLYNLQSDDNPEQILRCHPTSTPS